MRKVYENITELKNQLVSDVNAIINGDLNFFEKEPVVKFQLAMELCGLLFEEYREQYLRLVQELFEDGLSEYHMDIENIVFISWCSTEIFQRLNHQDLSMHPETLVAGNPRPYLEGY